MNRGPITEAEKDLLVPVRDLLQILLFNLFKRCSKLRSSPVNCLLKIEIYTLFFNQLFFASIESSPLNVLQISIQYKQIMNVLNSHCIKVTVTIA